jgi:hypothetical protein
MAQEGVPMQMSENERRQIIGMVGRWAEETEMVGLRAGIRLKGEGKLIATRAGVKSLGLVRVVYCDALPVPSNNALYQLGRQLGVFADTHIGLTIGHAVFLKRGPELRDNGILAHELMHVAQVERLGGLWGFVTTYFDQVVEKNYFDSPLEIEARKFAKPFYGRTSNS